MPGPGEADRWEDRMPVGGAGEGAALGGKWLHEAQDTAGLRKEFLSQLLDPKASTEMKALPGLARRKDQAPSPQHPQAAWALAL